MPEEGVAADVASTPPRDAQDPSGRNGRASTAAGAERVVTRGVRVGRFALRTGLLALGGATTEGVDWTEGDETG